MIFSAALFAASLLPQIGATRPLAPRPDRSAQGIAPPAFEHRVVVVQNWDAELRVTLTEQVGTGANLFLRRGAPATLTEWDARSATPGTSNESVVLTEASAQPLQSGTWYVSIYRPGNTVFGLDIQKSPLPSARPGVGATPYSGGTTFRVWAPNANSVHVAGTFNGWSSTTAPLASEGAGHWSLDIRNVAAGARYQYVIGAGTTTQWRADPRSLSVVNSASDSIVVDHGAFDWGTGTFQMPAWNDLVMYEMHVGTFNDAAGGAPGTFSSAVQRLDHLQALGINMIALMPVNEFPGDYSWGYNPAHPFAPETAYGSVSALKTFVREAHARGMAVTLDVLYNHLGPNDIPHWQFDGSWPGYSGGIYFYDDTRAQTPWGNTRPNYDRAEVRALIRDNALMWLEDYRMDGLRFDATAYIRTGPTGDLPSGWSLMQWVNNEIDVSQPWKYIVAEDLRNNDYITRDTGIGGAGFDGQWDAQFVHPIRAAVVNPSDAGRDMWSVRDAITARYNTDAFERVIYSESHDEVANGRSRVPEEIWPGNAASWYSKKRSTLAAALVMTSPGVPMLFQGQEILEDEYFRDTDPVDWTKLAQFAGIRDLYADLIALRRNVGGTTAGLKGQNVRVHHVNDGAKVIAFHRWDQGGAGDDVIVLANFSNTTFPSYRIGVPRPGLWRLRFNSDASVYDPGYSNHPSTDVTASAIPYDGMAYSIDLTIAPYTALVLSQ
ncbi:1,4-alpha-glucan branching enzyme GlgB [Planctomycetes bacterium Poly30]|uniref:1,4-alpha-glucan branching enzyme n=1 Tax=Saltatorellus ferox TaxID=2528018 RepID=A0A518EPJ6_9BACT|nr:1,4-alpha-glucan branching enzyme GlgB [Planctomycetes bacterium Poly30]